MSSFESRRDPPPKGPFASEPEDGDGELIWRQHPLPLERAILWYPAQAVSASHSGRKYLRFITLGALKEIALHVATAPDQGRLGFLAGGSFSCPNSRVRYVVIDATLQDPVPIRDDRTSEVIDSVWVSLQEQLQAREQQLLGWYHTHPGGGLQLTASDIITHSRFFPAPWQVAMLLEPGAERSRAVVCEVGDEKPPNTVLLPFYELLEPAALATEGARPDYVTWQDYRTVAPAERPVEESTARPVEQTAATRIRPGPSRFAPSGFPPQVLMPSELDDGFGWSRGRLRRWLRQSSGARRILRAAGLGAIIVVAVATWKLMGGGQSEPVPTLSPRSPASVRAPVQPIDRLAENVREALKKYDERAWLFDDRKMTCAELADGLKQVVDQWYAYNAEGRPSLSTLDAERRQRGENLFAGVRKAELHFGASGCPTP